MRNRIVMLIFLSVFGFIACQNPKEKLADKIKFQENILFSDSMRTLNDSLALATLELYSSYANQFPEDSISVEYLFKSADLALGVKKAPRALESLELLIQRYPQSSKASSALFMQAFIHETAIQDKEGAKTLFSQFMQKYPDHPLYNSAKASFDQLNAGMSDEELIRMFESKQDSLVTAVR